MYMHNQAPLPLFKCKTVHSSPCIMQKEEGISLFHGECTGKAQDFIVGHLLQQGAYGVVYSGLWVPCNKKVAMKFFGYGRRRPKMSDIGGEIQMLKSLSHISGIVHMEAVFMDTHIGVARNKQFMQSFPCVVTELLEGGDLLNTLEKRAYLSENELKRTFSDIITTVAELHRNRYVHCDIKLENIMFTHRGPNACAKLIDVGMMVQLPDGEKEHRSEKHLGTAGYRAPETILEGIHSPATDVWQVGVCLYGMLVGSPPFDMNCREQIVQAAYFPLRGPRWDEVSDVAKDLVRKILKKDPSQRPTAGELMSDPWIVSTPRPLCQPRTEDICNHSPVSCAEEMDLFCSTPSPQMDVSTTPPLSFSPGKRTREGHPVGQRVASR